MRRLREWLVDPQWWQRFHAAATCHWLVLLPVGLTIWRESIWFLMYVSLATALTGSLTGYGTALAGRKADPEDPL